MEESNGGAQLYPVDWNGGLRGRGPGHGTDLSKEKPIEIPIVEPNSPVPFKQQPVAGVAAADDLRLLKRAGAGDARAFHTLVDHHGDRLFRLARSLLRNTADAEDVVQETFAGAYRGIAGFEGRAAVGTWLTRILITQVAKWRRDHKRRTEPLESAAGHAGGQSGSAGVDSRIDLEAALAKLSPEHQQILVLREFEQMSYDEMAEVLDLPRGTVESRLHRARGELREKLKVYGVE